MPGDISRSYKGPKDGRVPSWLLRGGPGQDYPCENAAVTECALSECQHQKRCKLAAHAEGAGD